MKKTPAEKLCYTCARIHLPEAYKSAKRWEVRQWYKMIGRLAVGTKWCPGYPHDVVKSSFIPQDCLYPLEQVVLRQALTEMERK